jgi:hypothetical protein
MTVDPNAQRLGCCPSCNALIPAQAVMRGYVGYKEDFDILCQVICPQCGSHLIAEDNFDDHKSVDCLRWQLKPAWMNYQRSPTDRTS